jgi:hypothetical protein
VTIRSLCADDAGLEQIEFSSAIHLAFEQLELADLTLGLAPTAGLWRCATSVMRRRIRAIEVAPGAAEVNARYGGGTGREDLHPRLRPRSTRGWSRRRRVRRLTWLDGPAARQLAGSAVHYTNTGGATERRCWFHRSRSADASYERLIREHGAEGLQEGSPARVSRRVSSFRGLPPLAPMPDCLGFGWRTRVWRTTGAPGQGPPPTALHCIHGKENCVGGYFAGRMRWIEPLRVGCFAR